MTDKKIPKQQFPVLDPDQPTTANRYSYYILEEPNSPSVAPPKAIRVVQYRRRQFLHNDPDDNDYRRPYGFVEYSRELTFNELDEYNLLPFDPDLISLFDLWQDVGKDKVKLLAFFKHFFAAVAGDKELRRLGLAIKLRGRKWDLDKAKAAVKGIK